MTMGCGLIKLLTATTCHHPTATFQSQWRPFQLESVGLDVLGLDECTMENLELSPHMTSKSLKYIQCIHSMYFKYRNFERSENGLLLQRCAVRLLPPSDRKLKRGCSRVIYLPVPQRILYRLYRYSLRSLRVRRPVRFCPLISSRYMHTGKVSMLII